MAAGFNTLSLVLVFVSFVFLLLATISVPVVPAFRLAATTKYYYGVFGACTPGSCTAKTASFPYLAGLVERRLSWLLAESTRNSLSKTLILVPIACGFNLICTVLILLSHFLSHGMIIFALVFNVVTFLLTAVIAVLTVLLFHPYVAWTGWILIGSAALCLVSIVFLVLALRTSSTEEESDVESINEITTFENKFGNSTFAPPTRGFNNGFNDNSSSISKDYDFKVAGNQQNQISNTLTNSSIYNSNPQLAKDFTHTNQLLGSRTAGSSHYEDARNDDNRRFDENRFNESKFDDAHFVNGPNTPISSKQQMAPSFVPNVATPTTNDTPESRVPRLPYPANGPLNKPPYQANMSVFEHHPEVEGHKPFTELDDEPDQQYHRGSQVSDVLDDSNFTSVSQRAPNPQYQYDEQYPQQQPFQPLYQQNIPQQYSNGFHGSNQGYAQGYGNQSFNQNFAPQNFGNQNFAPSQNFAPQRFVVPRPQATASDNALANNPDFALGPAARKKPGMNKPGLGPSRMGVPSGKRDGPYGMI